MRVITHVKTGAKQEKVAHVGPHEYRLTLRERPIKNQANKRIQSILSEFLHTAPSRIHLLHGQTHPTKLWEIR